MAGPSRRGARTGATRDWAQPCRRTIFCSSRRRHTRLVSDWSSDVCSSDLSGVVAAEQALQSQLDEIESGVYSNGKFEGTSYRQYIEQGRTTPDDQGPFAQYLQGSLLALDRSEERRVGKEGRSRWSPYH